jgi:hypothetical protein
MDGKAEKISDGEAFYTGVDGDKKLASGLQEPEKVSVKAPEAPVRRNFNETAFFFPALMTDEKGDVHSSVQEHTTKRNAEQACAKCILESMNMSNVVING